MTLDESFTIEVCIDSVHSALAAQQGGAHRVELCDNLFEGGTTPSAGCIEIVRKQCSLGLYVMIRPRGGDFLYSALEFDIMRRDVQIAKDLGADGVVFGLLVADGTIDKERTQELLEISFPLDVTFHRAFDMTPDPFEALNDLIGLKVNRILTSGQDVTAFEGAELISELVKRAGNKLSIMPGGGVTERNIEKIRRITGCHEFHVSGRKAKSSEMAYKKTHVFMGGALRQDEFRHSFSDADAIQAIKSKLK